jgi:hypothetical protein
VALAQQQVAGLLELEGDRLRLSAAGRIVANEVLVAFLP